MDDDLDFSNDSFLLQLQQHKHNIENRLTICRDGMQATVDHISYIESSREIEKIRIGLVTISHLLVVSLSLIRMAVLY